MASLRASPRSLENCGSRANLTMEAPRPCTRPPGRQGTRESQSIRLQTAARPRPCTRKHRQPATARDAAFLRAGPRPSSASRALAVQGRRRQSTLRPLQTRAIGVQLWRQIGLSAREARRAGSCQPLRRRRLRLPRPRQRASRQRSQIGDRMPPPPRARCRTLQNGRLPRRLTSG